MAPKSPQSSIDIKQIESIIEQRACKGFRPERTGKHKKGRK